MSKHFRGPLIEGNFSFFFLEYTPTKSNCIDLIFRGQLTTESVMFHQFSERENGLLLLRRGDESFHSKTNDHDLLFPLIKLSFLDKSCAY